MSDLEEDGDKQDARAVMLMTPSPPPKAKAKKKKTRERHDPLHEKEDEYSGSDADDDDSTTEDSEERRKTRHRHHQHRRRRRKERKRSPSPPPPPKVAIVPLDPEGGGDAKKIGGCWDFLFNLIAMVVFASALSLYVMPGTMTPILFGFGGGGGGGNRPAESTTATNALHPEWPLHTFETAGARKRTASVPDRVKRAVQSDAALYKKVIDTLSYHVLRDDGKRVLCMWHLQHPVSIPIANVCVWKRRLPGVSIFSLGEPVAEEGMLLPMFNLEIKGYATNISKVKPTVFNMFLGI
jgi:hypothetical protein